MFSTDAPQLIEHLNIGVTFTPADVRWLPGTAQFAGMGTRGGKGVISLYELKLRKQGEAVSGTGTELAPTTTLERPAGLQCGTFGASLPGNTHLAYGDYDGGLTVLDLTAPANPVFSVPNAHAATVLAIDGCGGQLGHGSPEIVTGSRDGRVRVWDPRVQDPVLSLEPGQGSATAADAGGLPGSSNSRRECWAVAFGNSFNDSERCVAAGYDNGDIKLFDMRASKMRWEDNTGNGIVSLEFDRRDIEMNKLVATMLESRFRVYDMRTQHPEAGFACLTEKAHKATVWLVRHLPQNRDVFLTAGGNGGLNIYKYHYPTRRSQPDAHQVEAGVAGTVELLNARVVTSQPVVAWDWHPGKAGLAAAACLDQTLRVFIVTKLDGQ